MRKFKLLVLACSLTILTGCSLQGDDLNTNIDDIIANSKIDFKANECWKEVYSYIHCLGKPIGETYENYANLESLGYAVGGKGVVFKDQDNEVLYFFSPDDFGELESESPENYKLILKGSETCAGVGANMSRFFPEFKATASEEESFEYLEKELGIKKILFANTEDLESPDYMAILVGNSLIFNIGSIDGTIQADSPINITLLDDYWKKYLFSLWAETD